MAMSSKLNISQIVLDHIKTLRAFKSQNVSKIDVFVFYIFPLIIAFTLSYFGSTAFEKTYSLLSTSFSIFAALLFSLLAIIYMLHQYWTNPSNGGTALNKQIERKRELLSQTFSNVSYCILICVVNVVTIVVVSSTSVVGEKVEAFVVYYLSIHFLFTLLMVLKRMHLLIADDVR